MSIVIGQFPQKPVSLAKTFYENVFLPLLYKIEYFYAYFVKFNLAQGKNVPTKTVIYVS
jgi:hypothetical protein